MRSSWLMELFIQVINIHTNFFFNLQLLIIHCEMDIHSPTYDCGFFNLYIFMLSICNIHAYYVLMMKVVVKKPPGNAKDVRDTGLILGWGRSPGEGTGYPL